MNAPASLGAITGNNITTGVGSAANKNTLDGATVVGNFRKTTCKTIDLDNKKHLTPEENYEYPNYRRRRSYLLGTKVVARKRIALGYGTDRPLLCGRGHLVNRVGLVLVRRKLVVVTWTRNS